MLPLLMTALGADQSPCGLPTSPSDWVRGPWIIFIVLAIGYVLVMGRMRKKQQQKRQDELGGIRKNARIMTIGGIYGTVVQVRDDKKVVIKIDETTNTRMTISRSAVRSVLSGKEEEDEKETK